MTEHAGRSPAEVIALFERVEAAMRHSADLAERLARTGGTAGSALQLSRADARRARIAASSAHRHALRLSVRELAGTPIGAEIALDGRTWHPAAIPRADGVAVIATDLAGTVRVWNGAAERLYGWPASEALGKPITALTVGPEDAAVAERIMAAIRRCGSWEGEFWVRGRDGTRFLAFVRNVQRLDAAGRPAAIVGFSVELPPYPTAVTGGRGADATSEIAVP